MARDLFDVEHLRHDLKARSVRGGTVTLGAQILKLILQLASTAILARLLLPADFGLVAMVTSVVGFLSMFKDMGLTIATVQREEIDHAQVSTLFWVNVAGGALIAALMTAVAPGVAWFFGRPELLSITIGFAAGTFISSFGAQHLALLQRQMRFRALAARDLIARSAGIVAAVVAASSGAGYWSLVILHGVTEAASVAALWLGCPWRPGLPRTGTGVRSMLLFGGSVSASNLLGYFTQNLDKVLLGYAFGAQSVGFYSRAQSLLLLPVRQLLPPLAAVANPALCRLSGDPSRFAGATIAILRHVALASTLFVACLLPVSDWVVRLVLGEGWEETARIVTILGAFAFVESCASILGNVVVAAGQPGRLIRYRIYAVGLTATGLAAGLPWGSIGVAAGYALSGVLARLPLFLWFVGRYTPLRTADLFKTIVPFVLIAGATAASVAWLRALLPIESPIFGVLWGGAAACSIYAILLSCFAFGRETIRQAFGVIRVALCGR